MESEQDKIDFAKSIDRIIKMWDHKNGIIGIKYIVLLFLMKAHIFN